MTVLVLDNPELIARVAAMEAEQAARKEAEQFQIERIEKTRADAGVPVRAQTAPDSRLRQRDALALVG